jgi:hypothetical protein
VRNLLTDVPGVLVGNAHDVRVATGVTVAVFEQSVVASVATLGGAPGDRAVTLLEPEMTCGMIDAIVLSGGSLYGLDAAGGVTAVLCRQGKGAQFGGLTLPVAVQAILFDLVNGGEKEWLTQPVDKRPPYWDLGRDAGHGGRGLRRHHGHRQGRARLGKHADATGLHCRCIGGGERGRLGADRRWPAFLGRTLRAG